MNFDRIKNIVVKFEEIDKNYNIISYYLTNFGTEVDAASPQTQIINWSTTEV